MIRFNERGEREHLTHDGWIRVSTSSSHDARRADRRILTSAPAPGGVRAGASFSPTKPSDASANAVCIPSMWKGAP
jgi:hypothetical protein